VTEALVSAHAPPLARPYLAQAEKAGARVRAARAQAAADARAGLARLEVLAATQELHAAQARLTQALARADECDTAVVAAAVRSYLQVCGPSRPAGFWTCSVAECGWSSINPVAHPCPLPAP
jgi:hypothetical protein